MKDVLGRAIVPKVYKGFNCYQLEATGEIGMSAEELSKVCGIHRTAITAVKSNTSKDCYAPQMTPFVGRDVELTRVQLASKGQPKLILKWDFCCALMSYHECKKVKEANRIINKKDKLLPGEIRCVNADRVIEDGREYFILKNGDKGMSVSGLARACSVPAQTIQNITKNLSGSIYQWSKPFDQESIVLSREATKKGRPVIILRLDFCEAVIAHFACRAVKRNNKKKVEIEVLNFNFNF